jgi:hypothetical protein
MMRMKWLVGCSLLVSSAAFAQTTPPATTAEATMPPQMMNLSADGNVSLPVGSFSDGAGVGLGALLRYEYVILPQLNITGRVGFIYHLPKSQDGFDTKFWTIPVLAGVKLALNQSFYVAGELGLFSNHATVTATGVFGTGSASASETDFGFTGGVGYRTGNLDARLALNVLDLSNASDTMAIAANLGFSFWGQ